MGNYKSIIKICIFFIVSFVSLSCENDRYQLQYDKQGRTIRLDKKTGEVAIISGDRLIIAKSPKEVEAEENFLRLKRKILASPKAWPVMELKQIGVDKIMLTTMWKNNLMYYQLILSPVPRGFNEYDSYLAPFTLNFYDSSGFKIISIKLSKDKFTNNVNENGKVVAIFVNSSVQCSQDEYEVLDSFSLSYRL